MSREDIVVSHQTEIQVYVGDTGYIVIKQVDWPEDDVCICIDPKNVKAVADAMTALVQEASLTRKEWLEGENVNS